ncbi:bifunctional (p)ppGpp synthetase/guanosine-3',5'-bis(diphosphate) 3'-pyrophosphohydrolase [Marinilabiliaceae bacterium JC017]|nr:bifunctional (p)ppGpp synthetase/guanosine-3',5'-bis(diphosphate) 3'-pyrophosphohydrolase [Marinilabiliaceae bacterium JC017]
MERTSAQERNEIVTRYRYLLKISAPLLQKGDVKLFRKAMDLVGQNKDVMARRPSGVLSIIHALDVARIVVEEIGLGRTSVICALLYDVIQTARIPSDEIEKLFGPHVARITQGLEKVADLYQRNTSIQNENFRKLLLTFAEDLRVVLIIIADRLQAMRSLDLYDTEGQQKVSAEVGYLYAPMAHRLGLYNIKSEMEDLVMKYTNRDMYKFIATKLNETKRARDQYIKEFIEPLKKELEEHGLKFEIKGRTKTIHSIWNKLKKQNVEFEQVYDLFAIRVILDSTLKEEKADCWKVYSIVADRYQPNPSRMRDWLSIPKSNGYESLHTTVLGPENKWVEVQIRTVRMNEIAEKGLAAHWRYKGIKGEKGMDEWLSNIREVIENPELNARDFIDDFKLNLYDKEVFVFTPKGDLRRLPKGATVLDFAFDIHTEVGKKCVGAKVNQRNVPIKYAFQNGDQVEILTSNHQQPKQDWLNIVVTSRAKTKLKQAIKEIQYKEAEIGRELLERRLKNWKYELSDHLLHQLVKGFKFKTVHDFLREVGLEKLDLIAIKEFIQELGRKEKELEKDGLEPQQLRSAENFIVKEEELHQNDDILVIDQNLSQIDYKLAICCNPIFGDEIFGFVSATGGIKIHRKSCPNATDMRTKYGYRIVKAQWTGGTAVNFQATLKVTGNDDIGIVTNISQVITKELKVKMRSITIDSHEGMFEGTVTVFVNNTNILSNLIKKVKSIKGVYDVARIDAVI